MVLPNLTVSGLLPADETRSGRRSMERVPAQDPTCCSRFAASNTYNMTRCFVPLQVLFAFMVGLHNLYWYYGSQTYEVENEKGELKLVHASEAFQG